MKKLLMLPLVAAAASILGAGVTPPAQANVGRCYTFYGHSLNLRNMRFCYATLPFTMRIKNGRNVPDAGYLVISSAVGASVQP